MSYPAHIFIVRHAEKPGEAHVDGPNDGPNLSVRGHTRAAGLALLKPFPHAVHHIFATKKTKGSVRPIETITPFAKAINGAVESKFADEEFDKLAKKILNKKKYIGKTIVIAWHHGKIPGLIKALGGDPTVAPMKNGKWDANVFDRIIHLEYSAVGEDCAIGKGYTVLTKSLPQQLLFGDSAK